MMLHTALVLQVAEVWLEPTKSAYRASQSRLVLLRLITPLQLDKYVWPVRLPQAELPNSNLSQCQMLGYGLVGRCTLIYLLMSFK